MDSGIDHRRNLGALGEDLACAFLIEHGHMILERNWRCRHLEVDVISFDSDGIHFVEVKTRQNNIQAPPQMSVDRAKQNNIIKAAKQFLKTGKGVIYRKHECHFDIVAVTFENGKPTIEWFPQAYIPLYL